MSSLSSIYSNTTAQNIPSELIQNILCFVGRPIDLLQCSLTCKAWSYHAMELLWYKPYFAHPSCWYTFCDTLEDSQFWMFPYTSFIRRINLSSLSTQVTDTQLLLFSSCDRLERVTLVGCSSLSDDGILGLLSHQAGKHLTSMDLGDITNITDATIIKIANTCPNLQGLNLSMCKDDRERCTGVTDDGIITLAGKCRHLRRIKLNNCDSLTDASALALARHCPRLLEIDCPVTDEALMTIFTQLRELRDFRLQQCGLITDTAFTPLSGIQFKENEPPMTLNRSLENKGFFDQLRLLDLTNANFITDESIRLIIHAAPKIRNLVLNKCKEISDEGVSYICQLGRHLHYLHLGHCDNLTDRSITKLATSCSRIRYLDLAQCSLLTNASVHALANLPRLKRIGLVKCFNITDDAIDALTKQPRIASSLERVHLSYCVNLTDQSIRRLLNFCPRLNHLSLTHVPAFLRPDFQRFRRTPPKTFTPQQQNVFCVFSGKGVKDFKAYLNEITPTEFLSLTSTSTSIRNNEPGNGTDTSMRGVGGGVNNNGTSTTPTPTTMALRDHDFNQAIASIGLNQQRRLQQLQSLYQQQQQLHLLQLGETNINPRGERRTTAQPLPAQPVVNGPGVNADADEDIVNELFLVDDERLME